MKDLSHLDVVAAAAKGMSLDLTGPDGQPTGVTLGFMGLDADKTVIAAREFDKDAADHPRKDEHIDDTNARRRAHIVAAAVTDWGDLALDGIKITSENAAGFLATRRYAWIANAIYARASLRVNFFPKGSAS